VKKKDRRESPRDRRDTRKPTPSSWMKPDFVELSACAEIGAYVFTA
jgi:hypothetical protein